MTRAAIAHIIHNLPGINFPNILFTMLERYLAAAPKISPLLAVDDNPLSTLPDCHPAGAIPHGTCSHVRSPRSRQRSPSVPLTR